MAKQKQEQAITHEELQRAIRKFQEQGGLIKQLPDEDAPTRNLVGARYGGFEPVFESHLSD